VEKNRGGGEKEEPKRNTQAKLLCNGYLHEKGGVGKKYVTKKRRAEKNGGEHFQEIPGNWPYDIFHKNDRGKSKSCAYERGTEGVNESLN